MSSSRSHVQIPPPQFGMVDKGVYRSAYPTVPSVPYLRNVLHIQTIVLLGLEALPGNVARSFLPAASSTTTTTSSAAAPSSSAAASAGVRVLQLPRQDWLDRSSGALCTWTIQCALDIMVNTASYPLLVCCATGDVETSVVVGCYRRWQRWSLTAIFAEAELYCSVVHRVRLRRSVMQCIEEWAALPPSPGFLSMESIALRTERCEQFMKMKLRIRSGEYPASVGGDAQISPALGPQRPQASKDVRQLLQEEALFRRPPTVVAVAAWVVRLHHEDENDRPTTATSSSVSSTANNVISSAAGATRTIISAADAMPSADGVAGDSPKILKAAGRQAAAEKGGATTTAMPAPHVLYRMIRNPPALDSRSTFNRNESLVEEDDD